MLMLRVVMHLDSIYKMILFCYTEFKLGGVHSLPTNEEASGEGSNNRDELCNQNGKYL